VRAFICACNSNEKISLRDYDEINCVSFRILLNFGSVLKEAFETLKLMAFRILENSVIQKKLLQSEHDVVARSLSPKRVRFVSCSVRTMKFKEFLVIFMINVVMFLAFFLIYEGIFMISTVDETKLLSCGERPMNNKNVWGGSHAVLRFKSTNDFFCGSSLISERHVITDEIFDAESSIANSFCLF
jgi:hypothetical protein